MTQKEVIEKIRRRIESPFRQVFGEQIDFEWNSLEIRAVPSCFHVEYPLTRKIDYDFNIILYYPELTVFNTTGLSHDIKDLYVRLRFWKFRDSSVGSHSFEGLRTTYTEKERKSDYCHSHLSGVKTNFGPFCTSGSADLTNIFTHIAGKIGYLDLMEVYLLKDQLHAYLSWESLEGVPYRKFQDIGLLQEYNLRTNTLPFSILNDYHLLDFPCSLKINKDFKIKNKEEISKSLLSTLTENGWNAPVVVKIGNRYFTEAISGFNVHWEEQDILVFKGEVIKLKVIEDSSLSSYEYYLRPDLLETLCLYWEDKIRAYVKRREVRKRVDSLETKKIDFSTELQEAKFSNEYILLP